ncbi:MAG: hypothetical protein PHZ02_09325 [Desulfocapsaceae bacterium]|nr:hypothetical protein [Desulfocapsaceae bacterium]
MLLASLRKKHTAKAELHSARSIIWGIFFFLMLTVIFGVFTGKWEDQHNPEKRNIFFRRGWVKHVLSADKIKRPDKLIVIISNSQGYGRELSDRETYPALLEKYLILRQKENVRVLNWSIPGGQVPDFTILAAAAKRLAPDILIFVDSPADFSNNRMELDPKKGLRKNFISDCHFLLWFSNIRKSIPSAFLAHFIRPIDYLDIFFAHIFAPWRYRDIFTSRLMQIEELRPFDKSGKSEKWFFQTAVPRQWYVDHLRAASTKAQTTTRPINISSISLELLSYFLDTTQDMKGEKYFVFMPLHSSIQKKNSLLLNEFTIRSAAKGFKVVDLSNKVPDNQYLTLTHFNAAGHATMAHLFVDLLAK